MWCPRMFLMYLRGCGSSSAAFGESQSQSCDSRRDHFHDSGKRGAASSGEKTGVVYEEDRISDPDGGKHLSLHHV